MDWIICACFVLMNMIPLYAHRASDVSRLLRIIQRRNFMNPRGTILRAPRYPEDLPAAEPILPGHTLLRPAKGMLRSAIKFPLRDVGGAAVYGNLDNLGITYGKTPHRIRYSNFRKANVKTPIQSVIDKLQSLTPGSLIVIEIDPSKLRTSIDRGQKRLNSFFEEQDAVEENSASEVLDDVGAVFQDSYEGVDFRRKIRKNKSKFRNRDKNYDKRGKKWKDDFSDFSDLDPSDSSDSSSSSMEKNPGNPYTIHKNKYKQNWIWNHFMDGDHMNINPYAPGLNSVGPSGPDLFFGRKWWYFNQDDFKPLS